MEIDRNKWRIWSCIEMMNLKDILTDREFLIITSLHGFKMVKRVPLNILALSLDMSEDEILDIHTKILLKLAGYNTKLEL